MHWRLRPRRSPRSNSPAPVQPWGQWPICLRSSLDRGEDLDARSDVFSLGVVLYEMATGHRAFDGNTSAVIFHAILERAPAAPSKLNPALPPKLEEIIDKTLEKDLDMR